MMFLPSELPLESFVCHSISAVLDTFFGLRLINEAIFFFSGRLRISSGFCGSSRSQASRQHLQVLPGLL